jgi:hypothetical protein
MSETYSLNLITSWLKEKNINFKYSSAPVDRFGIYEHGVSISFPSFYLSIQTHPIVTGWAFAETLKSDDQINETRHPTPEKLFQYLEELLS